MIIFFPIILLFWPMAYNYIGSLGLVFYTTINLLPLGFKIFINEFRIYNNATILIIIYTLFLLTEYLIGGIIFGQFSPESFRVILLPLAFLSGNVFWKQIKNNNFYIFGLINSIKIFIIFSVFSWLLIVIGVPFISKLYTYYAAGASFTESYINRVRYFGLAGQPAISSYLISYSWFVLVISSIYKDFIEGKRKISLSGFYFVMILISMLSTFSRSAVLSFLAAGIISYCSSLILNIFKKFSLNFKISIGKVIFANFLVISFIYVLNALSTFGRVTSLSNFKNAFIRIDKYIIVFDLISNNIIYFLFGYFINSIAMIEENILLYVTDSNFAFILSNTGVIGLILFLIIYFYLSCKLIKFPIKNNYADQRVYKVNKIVSLTSKWLILYVFVTCIFDPPLLDAKCLFFLGIFFESINDLKELSISDNKYHSKIY